MSMDSKDYKHIPSSAASSASTAPSASASASASAGPSASASASAMPPATVRSIDPKLLTPVCKLCQSGTGPGQLSGPRFAVFDSQSRRWVVTEETSHRIQIFDEDFISVEIIGSFKGENGLALSSPQGLAVDGTRLYIANYGLHCITVVNLKQTPNPVVNLTTFPVPASPGDASKIPKDERFNHPYGVCLYRGRLFVTDYGKDRVLVFRTRPHLYFETEVKSFNNGKDSLVKPCGIAALNNCLWVSEASNGVIVFAISHASSRVRYTGTIVVGGAPRGIAVSGGPTPMLFVTDAEGKQVRVYWLDNQGNCLSTTPIATLGGFSRPMDVAIKDDCLFVVDYEANNIQKFAVPHHAAAPRQFVNGESPEPSQWTVSHVKEFFGARSELNMQNIDGRLNVTGAGLAAMTNSQIMTVTLLDHTNRVPFIQAANELRRLLGAVDIDPEAVDQMARAEFDTRRYMEEQQRRQEEKDRKSREARDGVNPLPAAPPVHSASAFGSAFSSTAAASAAASTASTAPTSASAAPSASTSASQQHHL